MQFCLHEQLWQLIFSWAILLSPLHHCKDLHCLHKTQRRASEIYTSTTATVKLDRLKWFRCNQCQTTAFWLLLRGGSWRETRTIVTNSSPGGWRHWLSLKPFDMWSCSSPVKSRGMLLNSVASNRSEPGERFSLQVCFLKDHKNCCSWDRNRRG